MAIDNTPPRLKLIVTIAVITVITLVAIDFATKSYFAMMTDEAKHEKIAPTRDKDEQMKAEQAALTGASMPIDQAMAQVAKGTRPEAITPNASDDVGPVTGWSKLPHPAPTLQHAVGGSPATDEADGGALATDAGLPGDAGAGDAGARKAAADAGAPRAPRAPAPPHGEQHP